MAPAAGPREANYLSVKPGLGAMRLSVVGRLRPDRRGVAAAARRPHAPTLDPRCDRRPDAPRCHAGAQSPTTDKKPLDVPYVPTHESLVDEMLSMARVGGSDVLYDLGSGDGRIVITAARKFGTRGVGYDLDPERISEARENARRAGVTDRVRFEQQDIFTAKFTDATVITMYLLPTSTCAFVPAVSELNRHTDRSHNYDLGDWQRPAQEMDVNGINHTLYLWIVPQRSSTR